MTEFYDAEMIAGDQRDIATGEDGILLVSPIPVVRLEGGWHTLDLFDVICRGAIPLCSASQAYAQTGLDS